MALLDRHPFREAHTALHLVELQTPLLPFPSSCSLPPRMDRSPFNMGNTSLVYCLHLVLYLLLVFLPEEGRNFCLFGSIDMSGVRVHLRWMNESWNSNLTVDFGGADHSFLVTYPVPALEKGMWYQVSNRKITTISESIPWSSQWGMR